MNIVERAAFNIRHFPGIERLTFVWGLLRPGYDIILHLLYQKGLKRIMNGTDEIILSHEYRNTPEVYETKFWERLMKEVRRGDIIADIGAHIGLYTIALAKNTGEGGEVYAFEPDAHNVRALKRHIGLNKVSNVKIINAAVGDVSKQLMFCELSGADSYVAGSESGENKSVVVVQSRTLDEEFSGKRIDIIKIDVEGYEEKVFLGAVNILNRKSGYPRAIFIEFHPYAWSYFGSSGAGILSLLHGAEYRLETIDSKPVKEIKDYDRIIAYK